MEKTARGRGLTEEETRLWSEWLQQHTPEARLRLYEHYAPWMRTLAGHLAKSRQPLADWGDYLHFGAEGLLKAIDRFQPREGVRFQAYAEHYIRGAVFKGLECYRQDSRPKDTDRIAHFLPLPKNGDAALETLMSAAVDLAFGYFLESGVIDEQLPQQQDPYALHQHRQHVDYLALYVDKLPERERTVIRLHYYDHLGFAEIAKVMGVSKPRVTQLHGQGVARMREWFGEVERRR